MSSIEVVKFHGDELQVVRDGEKPWVVMRRVCESLDLDFASQWAKLKNKAWACIGMIPIHDASGREQELFCLHLDSLPMWLATIEPSRVKPAAREKLIAYQKECARVLADHFYGRREPRNALFDLRPLVESIQSLASTMVTVLERVTVLESRPANPSPHGNTISAAGHAAILSLVKSVAKEEHEIGRWKSQAAGMSGVRKALGEHVGWGGYAKGWEFLPGHLEQVALAYLRARLRDAETVAGSRDRHPLFALLGGGDKEPTH